MADTIRKQIKDRVVALLGAGGGPTGLTVHDFRTRPITQDKLPAVVVYAINESVDFQNNVPRVRRTLTLRFECRTAGDPPDDALDPILSWVVKKIMGGDATLASLTVIIAEVATQWDAVAADVVLGSAAIDFSFDYFTLDSNPEQTG